MPTKTLNIALPQDLVERVDRAAKKEYRNRSELIREALRVYLKDLQEWQELFQYGKMTAVKKRIRSEVDINRLVHQHRHGRRTARGRS